MKASNTRPFFKNTCIIRVTFLSYPALCSQKKCPFLSLLTFDGEDSAGADSGLLRGGTGGGTCASSEFLVKFMDDTEADPSRQKKILTMMNFCST